MRPPKHTLILIAWSALVFVASVLAAAYLPITDFFKGLASIPAVAALCGVLVQLWRDQLAHDRAIDLKQREQDFALATASHMATVAYDRHVAFCEAYIARVNQGLAEFFRDGPTQNALVFSSDLVGIRLQYRAWLTNEIESRLIPFETALRIVGANHSMLDHIPVGEQRSQVVRKMYDAFGLVMDISQPESEEQQAQTAATLIDALREIVGTNQLTALRLSATRIAIERAAPPTDAGGS